MNLGVSFAPLVPDYVVWAAFGAAAADFGVLLLARSRGALMRAIALGLMVLALANPSLTREDRDPIPSVAAVIIDKSPSQQFGDRTQQTEQARDRVARRGCKRIPGLEVRVAEAGEADGANDGTRLFSALSSTLADVPPDRVAGAIMITDGRVHDVPARSLRARLCRAGARADHRPCQRDRPPRRAHQDAALRHRQPVADRRLPRRGPGRPARLRRGDRAARRRRAGEARGRGRHATSR